MEICIRPADRHAMAHAPHTGILYGPIRSRRFGRAIGVNLLPPGLTLCNMNCAYCRYGWSHVARPAARAHAWPTPTRVERAVIDRLRAAARHDELIDRICVAGHGEPTLHPDFVEITGRLITARDRVAPAIRLAVLSNSTTAGWPEVRAALARYDDRYMKLDAGDPITYARLNGPGPAIEELIDALATLPGVVVHATFVDDVDDRIENTSPGIVAEWVAAVERIAPRRVQITTLGRTPAVPSLRPAPMRRLREIAEHVRSSGIPVDVFAAGQP